MESQRYTIRDLSDVAGIPVQNIRVWEKRYQLFKPERSDTNIRLYKSDDITKIVLVQFLINSAYRVGKLAKKHTHELQLMVRREIMQNPGISEDMRFLVFQLLEGDFVTFEEKLRNALDDISPLDFIFGSLIPLTNLIKVISSVQSDNFYCEKFVKNIILKVLISRANMAERINPGELETLIFQSDTERIPLNHGIINYLAQLKRYKSHFFFNKISSTDIDNFKGKIKPDIVYTEFNEKQSLEDVIISLNSIEKSFPLSKILVSGIRMEKFWKEIPNKVYFVRNPEIVYKTL